MNAAALLPKRATVKQLAEILERSEKSVRECINARKLKRGKDKKYAVAPVVEEHIERQKRNPRNKTQTVGNTTGVLETPATWSDQYKAKQVEKLEVQIGALRETLIPVEEHSATVGEVCGVLTQTLEEFVQWVAVEFRQAEASTKAKELRDRAKRWAVAKAEEYVVEEGGA